MQNTNLRKFNSEDLGEKLSKMNGKEHPPIKIIWLINSLEYETAAELIAELQEMKEKYPG